MIPSLSLDAQSLLHIRVLEGEGAIHPAGTKTSQPIIVQITDETGRPVDGAAVSFRMPEEGPGLTFARGMRTDIAITTPDGRAAMYDMQAGTLTGPYQVRVTVVKGQVRAGTLIGQYVNDAPKKAVQRRSSGRGKTWLKIAAVAAGGAAIGIALGGSGGSSGAKGNTPAPTVSTPPQIGTPSISVGRP